MDEEKLYAEAAPLLPEFFEPMLSRQYGPGLARRVVAGCAARRPVTLRANTLKASRAEVAAALDAASIAWEAVPWSAEAFVLRGARDRDVRALPAYEAGEVYLQSLSSMLPPLALGARPGEDVLDMCAAPGGKTTQIAALTCGKAHVTACEMNGPRAEKLAFNLERQGASNVSVMRADARRLDDFFQFDRVLLDAPCSGSGTLDVRNMKLKERFTLRLIEKTRASQQALLAKALRLVKPGGTVVYSTCSVLGCENEEVVRRAVATGPYRVVPVEIAGADALPLLPTSLPGALGLCPTQDYEGFFVAEVERLA